MLLDFEDHELERLYSEAEFVHPRIGPELTKAFRKKVGLLAAAADERDLFPLRSLRLEKLKGDRAGTWSIRLNDQFRLIIRFATTKEGRTVIIIELTDYHD